MMMVRVTDSMMATKKLTKKQSSMDFPKQKAKTMVLLTPKQKVTAMVILKGLYLATKK